MNDFIDKRKQNPRKRNLSSKIRYEILRRDGFTCQYCGKMGTECELEIDHIVPFSKGGTNDEGNLITSCFDCNRGKRDTEVIPNDERMPASATPIDETDMMLKLCANGTITQNTLRTHFNGKLKNLKDPIKTIKQWKLSDKPHGKKEVDTMNELYSSNPEYIEHTIKFGEPFDQLLACICISTMSIKRDMKMIRPEMGL